MELISELITLETEKSQAEIKLKEQIKSIRLTLNNLERKLTENEPLNDYDGLQGNGSNIDVYVSKIATYDKSISRFKSYVEKHNLK